MALSFANMVTRVENVTGVSSNTTYYLNKAQVELAKRAEKVTRATVAFTAGIASFPAGCLIARKLAYVISNADKELRFAPTDFFPYSTSTGVPTSWMIQDDDKIRVDTTYAGNLDLIYTPRSTDGTLQFPDSEEAMIAFAIMRFYMDDEKPDKAAHWKDRWDDESDAWLGLDKLRNRRRRKFKTPRWT